MDQKMSQLQQELFSTILGGSSDDPTVRQAVQVALVGRYFERIADQAVSVGERVDYIVTGELHHPDHSPDARTAAAPTA
jgi:phosphate transport system protein